MSTTRRCVLLELLVFYYYALNSYTQLRDLKYLALCSKLTPRDLPKTG